MGVLKLPNKKEASLLVKELQQDTFISHFPQDLTDELADLATIEEIPAHSELLREGEVNSKLFILLDGSLEVKVCGDIVSQLNKKGDVVGEMSLIAETPCSATVTTLTDCQMISFDHSSILHLTQKNSGKHSAIFYKVFAKILTARLKITNDKARRFEKANADLKKLHKELDEINQKRLQEISSAHHMIFKKIDKLYREDLVKIHQGLTKDQSPISVEESRFLAGQVEDSRTLIKPLADLYNSEKHLANKKVLLAETDKKQQRIAKMALRGSGLEIDIASNKEETEELLKGSTYDIMMFSDDLAEMAELAHQLNSKMKLVMVTSQSVNTYVQYFKDHPFLANIVSRNEEDRTFTIKNIFTTVGKLSSEDVFGMEKYLAWGVDIQAVEVSRSDKRQELLDQMSERFEEFGIRSTIIERCRLVGEEMLMNAIFDAPVNAEGKSMYNHLDRTQLVELKPEERAVFRYACDGMLAALSISDPFGALNKETLMTYLGNCYLGQENELHQGKGGGGMGIHLMVETSDLTVFNVHRGMRTEVIALFNVDKKISDQLQNPSFHLFYR